MNVKLNRRGFLKTAALASFAARPLWADYVASETSTLMFAGTQTGPQSKGIYAYHWDAVEGDLKLMGLAVESDNPTFLAVAPDASHLYAANEIEHFSGAGSGAVSAFSIDRAKGRLTLINEVSATGSGTCNVAVDHTGHAVFCANYTGGSAASFHADASGALSQAVSHFQYHGHGPDAARQEGPHAHRVTVSPDNRFLLVNDLGLDCIHVYHLNAATAALTPNNPPQWNATPGSGPRALRFHPNGKWAYCVHEMGSAVEVLHWNAEKGVLTSVQRLSLVPVDYTGQKAASEVVLDRKGTFVYVANRFYDRITSFQVNPEDGTLTKIARTTCGGKVPRHIALDPTERWLLVANQESDNIAVIRRDVRTGHLADTARSFARIKPQCLVFV